MGCWCSCLGRKSCTLQEQCQVLICFGSIDLEAIWVPCSARLRARGISSDIVAALSCGLAQVFCLMELCVGGRRRIAADVRSYRPLAVDSAGSTSHRALEGACGSCLGLRVSRVLKAVCESAFRELRSEVEALRNVAEAVRSWLSQPWWRYYIDRVLSPALVHLLVLLQVPLLLNHPTGWIEALLVEADARGLSGVALASDCTPGPLS